MEGEREEGRKRGNEEGRVGGREGGRRKSYTLRKNFNYLETLTAISLTKIKLDSFLLALKK